MTAVAPCGVGVIGLGDISDVYLDNLTNHTDIVGVTAVAARPAPLPTGFPDADVGR